MTRLALALAALTVVALAAWMLLGAPRGRGDAVSRAVPVSPATEAREQVDLLDVDVPAAPAEREAERAEPADEPERTALAASDVAAVSAPTLEHVRGRIRSESGGWADLEGALAGGVLVELLDPADPGFSRKARLAAAQEPDGSTAIAFRFEGLPHGTYRLSVSSPVAEVWEPREQTVTTPADDVEVWCRDRVDRVRLVFDVRDAETGEPIEGFEVMGLRQTVSQREGVLMHAAPLASEAFPVDGRVEWSVFVSGHAPAFGDETAFQPDGAGAWVARVALRRGWGARVVALGRDPTMRPLDGAVVEVDGAFVGQTGANGWLDLELAGAPGTVSVRWGELVGTVEAPRAPDSNEARSRGQQLLVLLE